MQMFLAAMDTKTNPKLVFSVYLLRLLLESHVSLAADTITANQSLSGDDTIVSAGGIFELGFFKPGTYLDHYYIGMWYSKRSIITEQSIVWVANRKQPVSDKYSSVLKISDGNLVLLNESKAPVWSTNLSLTTTSGSIEALLLDTGNLVLLRADGSSNSTKSEPLWQSFDHPTDTWLPQGRIGFNTVTKQTQILTSWKSPEDPAPGLFSLELDPNASNTFLILWNRSRQYWSTGSWDANTRMFSLVPELRINGSFNVSYVTNENESYFTYDLYDPKTVAKFVMSTSGQIQEISWFQVSNRWNSFWSRPRKQCEVYALCGAFGSCNEATLPSCNCLTGFEPESQRDWGSQAYSDGCSRKTSLHCANATSTNAKPDRFLEMSSMSLPENKQSVEVRNIADCESICLNNCSCTAYAHDSSTGCSIWHGELFDLRQLTANDSAGRSLYIKLAASEFKSPKSGKGLGGKLSLIIAMVSAAAGLLAIIFVYFLRKKAMGQGRGQRKNGEIKTNASADGGGKNDAELPLFSFRGVLAATNNFSDANKLGEGGFGPVYKGILQENQEVAVKRLSQKSGQGQQEFMNELKLIAKLQHMNLVRLLGCCIEGEERMLIYEYMPNRSLDKFLFADPSGKTELDWGKRFRIIEGIAQGLLYIHKYSRLKIIHRDLKASNVLLDGAMNPKISDFGMARIFEINEIEANTNRVVGTYGYMSPEYARYGHFSEKLDVFSFGVLLLEIVSGKRNAAFYHLERSLTLAGWAWELWKENRGMEVIDESVRETCRVDEALRCIHVGFLCVQEDPADRPTMSSVIHMLANEATPLPPSKEPAFSTHWNSNVAGSSSSRTAPNFSNNAVTISLPEGR